MSLSHVDVLLVCFFFEIDPAGKHVLVLEDLIDTGHTLSWIHHHISSKNPARFLLIACLMMMMMMMMIMMMVMMMVVMIA